MEHEHTPWCQHKGKSHPDAARRLSDTYNLHRLARGHDAIGQWFAVRLDDGTGDGVLYDSKHACVRHQRNNERYYTFIKINPPSMNPCEAEVMLRTARQLYDKGLRMSDPDHKHGGPDLIKRLTVEDELAMANWGIAQNLIMPWEAKE